MLTGDDVCLAALAKVDAANLHVLECRETCRERLIHHCRDDSAKVRDTAARCFLQIRDEQLSAESELIAEFIGSPAFAANSNDLLDALKGSVTQLPDVVCRIAERAVELHRAGDKAVGFNWWTGDMATLVLRLYEQTRDPSIKARCLNVLDSMIELRFGNVGRELDMVER